MDKSANKDIFDFLREAMGELPEPGSVTLDIERLDAVLRAAETLKALLEKSGEGGSIEVFTTEPFGTGTVRAEAAELATDDPAGLVGAFALADAVEIYPLTNGRIRIDLTFRSVADRIG